MPEPSRTTVEQDDSLPWWTSAVVYQIYPRSFADSDGNGIGDLAGIDAHLDHLSALGVDAVWLSPIYPSPMADMGYDISDYESIDPLFGTMAQFDTLLSHVHQRGMKLIMDLVVNHTSDEHPWFVESRSARDNPKRDWYWWRDARDGATAGEPGAQPNNWGSFFSGSVWTLDPATGQYYLHLFAPGQPDLNWENPEVRQAVYAMMNRWLDRGVDGFRMDVINMISKDPRLPDGRVTGTPYADGSVSYICGPRLNEFLSEMNREVFAGRDAVYLTVGEMPGVTVDEARVYTDPARHEIDMVFQFEHMGLDRGASKFDIKPLRLTDLKASLGRWQTGLAQVGWNSLYWDNHDQPRAVSRFGDDGEYRVASAKMLATVLHLQRGTPYVYQGEEIGMTNTVFTDIGDFRDIESINHYRQAVSAGMDPAAVIAAMAPASRDNARTPIPWNSGPGAGFSTGTPWIALNPNYPSINMADAATDPDSVFHHYRKLIALRHSDPVVVSGDFTMLLPTDEQVFAYLRRVVLGSTTVELLVLGNFSGRPADAAAIADSAGWAAAAVVIGSADPAGGLHLGPWEGRAYRREIDAN